MSFEAPLLELAPAALAAETAESPRMTTEQAAIAFGAVSLETKALLHAMLRPDEQLSSVAMNQRMNELQAGEALWQTPHSYYANMARKLAEDNLFVVVPAVDSEPTKFQLSEAGYHITRSLAGHVLDWGVRHNLPLRRVLGEPKFVEGAGHSMICRLAVLRHASLHPAFTRQRIVEAYEPFLSASSIRNHLETLEDSGLIERLPSPRPDRFEYTLPKRYGEPVHELLDIFRRAVTFDEAFYAAGNQLADEIIRDPATVRYLIKRVETTSRRVKDKNAASTAFVDHIAQRLRVGSRKSLQLRDIAQLAERELGVNQLRHLARVMRNDPRFVSAGEGLDRVFALAQSEEVSDNTSTITAT